MKNQNATALILLLFFTFNSYCQSITLEEVLGKGKVKVVTTFDKTFEFDKVVLKDSIYYGVNGNELVRIYSDDLSAIHLVGQFKQSDYKNKLFVSTGLMEFDFNNGYSSIYINYERQLFRHFNSRLSYGKSFNNYGLLSESSSQIRFLDELKAAFYHEGVPDLPSKQTFYTASLCFIANKNNSHLEVNVGYALIIKEPYTSSKYIYIKRESVNNLMLEIGYRLTLGSFIFRTGIGWPYGRYLSLGYAF